METRGARVGRRAAMIGAVAGAAVLQAPAVLGKTKSPYAGTTLHGAGFSLPFHQYLRHYFPDFEAQTGIKVDFDVQAFPVYNQRMDLELSTNGSAYDVIILTFIYQGRWIGAGWITDLDEYTANPNLTPADWEPGDFVAQNSMRDAKGHTYGFGVEAGTMALWAARADLLDKAGIALPKTTDELAAACDKIHGKDGVAAFTADNLHHWNWPPYLMDMGGGLFRNPPQDLMPTLDSPAAIKAATWYANMLATYAPPGVLSYTFDQATESQLSGHANFRTQALTWGLPLVKNPASKVRNTVRFGAFPSGPSGWFPGVAINGFGIPAGSRNKGAAWEFIKWALSKETLNRMVKDYGYPSICRRSVIQSEPFKETMTFNGQDLAALHLGVLDRAGAAGYMKYRTVPVFPQLGDKVNRAIEAIATKQGDPASIMKTAQAQAVEAIRMAGYTL